MHSVLARLRHPSVFLFLVLTSTAATAIAVRDAILGLTDSSMWGHEVQYLFTHNPAAFDFLLAYGHPGGPLIEGGALIHMTTGLSYETAVISTMTILMAVAIALTTLIIRALRPNSWWWIGAFGVLSLNWLYDSITPPSGVAAPLVVLLFIFAWYVYEQPTVSLRTLVAWGMGAGFLIATRTDIGIATTGALSLFLLSRFSWRKLLVLVPAILGSFILFDPFMWFMPLRHLTDLWYKMFFHYALFVHSTLGAINVLILLALPCITFLIFSVLSVRYHTLPMPVAFMGTLVLWTGLLLVVFLSSHYQAIRYFLPITLLWETLLPLALFTLIEQLPNPSTRAPWYVLATVYGYNLYLLGQSLAIHVLYYHP